MSSTAALIAKLQAQRESWCELRPAGDGQPRLAVRLRRPPEAELPELRAREGRSLQQQLAQAVCDCAVGWDGFTEAELLGAALGSSDPLPFDAAVWAEVVRDRQGWMVLAAAHLTEQINTHLASRAAVEKN
jgi:hypothetical protein